MKSCLSDHVLQAPDGVDFDFLQADKAEQQAGFSLI